MTNEKKPKEGNHAPSCLGSRCGVIPADFHDHILRYRLNKTPTGLTLHDGIGEWRGGVYVELIPGPHIQECWPRYLATLKALER